MHDNTPSHVSKLTREFFEQKRFAGEIIIEWPPSSPDLNAIENLWPVLKMKLYDGGKQYNAKADLLEAIKSNMSDTEPTEVKQF